MKPDLASLCLACQTNKPGLATMKTVTKAPIQ